MKSLKRMALALYATASVAGISAAFAAELKGDGKDLVMFTMTASNVYGANQIRGAEEEAAKLGYKLTVFQHNFSQPEQDQQVQQYIASGAKPAADHLLALGCRRGDQRRASAVQARARHPAHAGAERAILALRAGLFRRQPDPHRQDPRRDDAAGP